MANRAFRLSGEIELQALQQRIGYRGGAITPSAQAQYGRRGEMVDTRPLTPKASATLAAKASEGWPVFEAMLRSNKLPAPQYEFRFDAVRKWRFDIAFPQHRIAIEVDGGTWSNGRHTRGEGFRNDLEKMNAATVAGWAVLRYPPDRLAAAIDDLRAILYEKLPR